MIVFKTGNLLDDNSEALVNTVNCAGVMGRGIALQFKKSYPSNYKLYQEKCKKGLVVPGKMLVYEIGSFLNPKYVINFPTKRHWKSESRIDYIKNGLVDLVKTIMNFRIKSIAIPALGCGLGGLDWQVVKPEIVQAFQNLNGIEVNIYEPSGVLNEAVSKNNVAPQMTPGRAALVGLIHNYLESLLDPYVTLLEVHKLMYFLQQAGEELNLNYSKYYYGPYAQNLSLVLSAIDGHMLSGYADGNNSPHNLLAIVPGAVEHATKFLSNQPVTLQRMNRVVELVSGFETPFGLELLATVHWVAKEHGTELVEILKRTHDWNEHKKQFNHRQIEIALNRLIEQNWV